MEYRKQSREGMKSKISRLTGGGDAVGVDASDWKPSEPLNADVKTGMRPISRRQFKRGGKVDMKAEGKAMKKRADRAPRKDGGKAIADAIVNRDMKEANQEREGKKHIGGMKSGGRAKRDLGGGIPGSVSGIIPVGTGVKSMARQLATNGFKKGGRAGKAMGGGFAPPGAPTAARMGVGPANMGSPAVGMQRPGVPPMLGGGAAPMGLKRGGKVPSGKWEGSKKDEAQDAKLAKKHGMSKDKFERSAMDEKHDDQQSMKGLKAGGRAKRESGGELSEQVPRSKRKSNGIADEAMKSARGAADGFLKDYYKNTMTGRAINGLAGMAGVDNPYAENEGAGAVTMEPPQVNRIAKGDREAVESHDPYEDRPMVEGMESPPYASGGAVEGDLGTAVGHAIAAYHRAQSRHARKSGGRVGKAGGGGFGEMINNPKEKSEGAKKRGGPNINITINAAPKLPSMGGGMPPMPMPPPGPAPGMPPGMAPSLGPPGGMAGLGAGGPPPGMGAGPGGPPPGMPPKMPFKRGGAVKMEYGAGSGEGRLEKIEKYGRKAHAAGGKVHMTAGAGTGEGRLQKIEAYGKKA